MAERQAICRKAVQAFVAKKEAIAEELCWQMGRPIRFAAGEVDGLAERANYMIDIAGDALSRIEVEPKPGFRRYINREPLGVGSTSLRFPIHRAWFSPDR